MTKRRNRIKQITPLTDRLMQLAEAARTKAAELPPGSERDKLLSKASQAERTAQVDALLSTSGADMPL